MAGGHAARGAAAGRAWAPHPSLHCSREVACPSPKDSLAAPFLETGPLRMKIRCFHDLGSPARGARQTSSYDDIPTRVGLPPAFGPRHHLRGVTEAAVQRTGGPPPHEEVLSERDQGKERGAGFPGSLTGSCPPSSTPQTVAAGASQLQPFTGGFCPHRGWLPGHAACAAAGLAGWPGRRWSGLLCRFLEQSERSARGWPGLASRGGDRWCQCVCGRARGAPSGAAASARAPCPRGVPAPLLFLLMLGWPCDPADGVGAAAHLRHCHW